MTISGVNILTYCEGSNNPDKPRRVGASRQNPVYICKKGTGNKKGVSRKAAKRAKKTFKSWFKTRNLSLSVRLSWRLCGFARKYFLPS
jgi:hypothetical protein